MREERGKWGTKGRIGGEGNEGEFNVAHSENALKIHCSAIHDLPLNHVTNCVLMTRVQETYQKHVQETCTVGSRTRDLLITSPTH